MRSLMFVCCNAWAVARKRRLRKPGSGAQTLAAKPRRPHCARSPRHGCASAIIRADGHLRRDRSRRHEDPGGRGRRGRRRPRPARRPTPHEGGPATCRGMEQALRDAAARGRARRRRTLAGVGVGSPGGRSPDGTVSRRPQPAGVGGHLPARGHALAAARHRGSDRQRRRRSRPRPSSGSAPGASTLAARRLLGHRRRRRPRSSTASRGPVAEAAGEIGHMVVEHRRRALHLRAARVHGGLRRARRQWKRTSRELVEKGRKTDLFKLMKERERSAPHERRSGRARSSAATSSPTQIIDRAVGGARRRGSPRPSTCSTSRA